MVERTEMTSGIVYSTEHGRICPDCDAPIAQCRCRQKKLVPKGDGIVRVSRETKGRKGKGVTLITGVPLHPEGLRNLAKELKQTCGSGGTVKEGVIEIQGDHRDTVMEALGKKGYTVKRSG
ncbi:MAG: translation initiation factor Sui1 [Candidatus Manganitrophaceae bacterium]